MEMPLVLVLSAMHMLLEVALLLLVVVVVLALVVAVVLPVAVVVVDLMLTQEAVALVADTPTTAIINTNITTTLLCLL